MKVDDCSVDKVRLNYARLLITTPVLGEMNEVEEFLIDGIKFSIRLVEDLVFGIAEDACLVEYEAENESHSSEPACVQDDVLLVDTLVNHLHAEWSKGANNDNCQ